MPVNGATLQRNLLAHIRNTHRRLQHLSDGLSSGRKIGTVSDDVAGANRLMQLRQNNTLINSRMQNARRGGTSLERAAGVLQQISDSLSRARQIASQAANGTYEDAQRAAMAQELDAILEQSVSSIVDARRGDEYLFSGVRSDVAPYRVSRGPDGRIQDVTYQGASTATKTKIGGDETVRVNFVAPRLLDRNRELFRTLVDLRDAVESGDTEDMQDMLGRLKEAGRGLRTSLGSLGARRNQLNSYKEILRSTASQNDKLMSKVGDTDFEKAAMQYRQRLGVLKSVLTLASRRSRITLAKYI